MKKNIFYGLFALLIAIGIAPQAAAQYFSVTTPSGHVLSYSLITADDGTTSAQVSGFDSSSDTTGSLVIPSSVMYSGTTYMVTKIRNWAFKRRTGLTGVEIPACVTSISSGAFDRCIGLTSIVLPEGCAIIESYAFEGCVGLTSVSIPSSVTSIGYSAFNSCTGLTSITIPTSVTSLGGSAFQNCTGLTDVMVPVIALSNGVLSGDTNIQSVTIVASGSYSIPNNAFGSTWNCQYKKLSTVVLPDGCDSIGDYAFSGCTALDSIDFLANVAYIGNSAFENCTGLTSLSIPLSVTSIGTNAFKNCTGLTDVMVPVIALSNGILSGDTNIQTVTIVASGSYSIPNGAFGAPWYASASDYKYLTTIVLPDGCDSIGNNAFKGCTALDSIVFPTSVTYIGNSAFEDCTGLTSLSIPSSVTSIGANAFQNCAGLTSISIPSSVTSIGTNAFRNCTGLTDVAVPVIALSNGILNGDTNIQTVTIVSSGSYSIPNGAFGAPWYASSASDYKYLTTIVLPDGCDSIGNNAFKGCTALDSIVFPTSVTYIGNSAFEDCAGLTTLSIPSGVTTVGSYAFQNCTGLTDITVPSIAFTNYNVFANDTNLQSVTVLSDGTYTLPEYVFGARSNNDTSLYKHLTTVVLSDGCTSISRYAFKGCVELTTINIPSSVTSIGDAAFMNCQKLTTINIPAGVTSVSNSAFENCIGLTSVNLPPSVTSIGNNAFKNCSGLTSVIIPSTMTSLGNNAFKNCSGLTSVIIPSTVTNLGNNAFYDCANLDTLTWNASLSGNFSKWFGGNTPIRVFSTNLDWKNLPGNIHELRSVEEYNLLSVCEDAVSVDGVVWNQNQKKLLQCPPAKRGKLTLGEAVIEIGSNALKYCQIDTIDFRATNCTVQNQNTVFTGSQTKVLLVGSEVDVVPQQLIDLAALQRIDVDDDNWNHKSSDGILLSADGGTVVRYPAGRGGFYTPASGVHTLGEKSFLNCKNLTGFDLTGLRRLDNNVFQGCTSLGDTVTIPAGVDTIGGGIFNGDSIKMLYYNVINAVSSGSLGLSELTTLVVGDGVELLPADICSGCVNLTDITLPNTLHTIGADAFNGCTSLASIDLPASLRVLEGGSYGGGVFNGCTSLTAITLPDSLQTIGRGAFTSCPGLTEITIPAGVTSISYAFGECPNLKTVYYNAASALVDNIWDKYSVLHYNKTESSTAIENLVVGEGVDSIDAKLWIRYVDTLTLSSTVKRIKPYSLSFPKNVSVTYDNYTSNLRYLRYNVRDARVKSYDGVSKNGISQTIVFPYTLHHVEFGDSVRGIPAYCFRGCNQVREFRYDLALPDSLRYLGSQAFSGCTQITSATFPESLDSIGVAPFFNCPNIHVVHYNALRAADAEEYFIPPFRGYKQGALDYHIVAGQGTPASEVGARDNMPRLDSVFIGPGVETITSAAFSIPFNQLTDTIPTERTTYIVNNSTTLRSIGKGTFAHMKIGGFEFGDSLRVIGAGAFRNVTGLTKAMLPEGVDSIGDAAFLCCIDLDSVSLPSSLRVIGTDCFARDSNISYLHFDCQDLYHVHTDLETDAGNPFSHTTSLRTIDFGPNVQYLNNNIFSNACGLEHVEIPEGVTWIGEGCFQMRMSSNATVILSPGAGEQDGHGWSVNDEPAPLPLTVVVQPMHGGYYASKVDEVRLHKVVLPSTLDYIVKDAFSGNAALDTVVCRSSYPPHLIYGNSWPSLLDTVGLTRTLIVPCGAGQDYANAQFTDTTYTIYGTIHSIYHADYASKFDAIVETTPFDVQLMVNVDTMGTVEMECATAGVTLTASPNENHRFVQWSDGVTDNPRTVTLTADTTFTAQFAWGVLYTITVGSGNATRGSATGGGTFIQDTTVILTAEANYGYHFTQWSDGDTTNPRLYTVTANATLNASFAPNQYAIALVCDEERGTVTGGGVYNYNTTHTISATALTGYHFMQWSDGNTDNPRSLTLVCDTTFTAQFEINVYALNVSCDTTDGSVGGAGSYEHGDTAIISAVPAEGRYFSQWSDGNTDNPRVVTMTGDSSFTAMFALLRYSVTVGTDSGDGTATASLDTVEHGSSVTITATASYGYHFTQWNDGNTDNPRTLVVVCDTAFGASFERNSYAITLTSNNGNGTLDGDGTYLYGDTITITATPIEHWSFDHWGDGNTENPRQIVVTEDKTYQAYFVEDQVVLSVSSNDPQQGSVTGGGMYSYGETVWISAQPKNGFHFSQWQDGNSDNPRSVTVTCDTTFTAFFEADETEGIDDVLAGNVKVSVSGMTITVSGADDRIVQLFGVDGRRLYCGTANEAIAINVPSTGVYMLQVDGHAARKIVVTR